MPLVAAKCTQCGGNLDVDSSQEAAICPHCKTPFITEKAINNFNTTNVTNIDTINAEVVNVESSDSADNLYKAGKTNLDFQDFDKASSVFQKMTDTYPQDYRGWYGLILAKTINLKGEILNVSYFEYVNGLVQKLSYLQKDTTLIDFDSINNYILAQSDGVRSKVDKEYGVQPIEKKLMTQKRCKRIKKASVIVSIVFLCIYAALLVISATLHFSTTPAEYHFAYEGMHYPSEGLFFGDFINATCTATLVIAVGDTLFTFFWLLAMLTVFILGIICCSRAKTPITNTFALSPKRDIPRLSKTTPIVPLFCLLMTSIVCICIFNVILASRVEFPPYGVELYWLGFETDVFTAGEYVAIHIFHLFLVNFFSLCVACIPFFIFFLFEKRQAKKQLEYELKAIKYIKIG